MNRKKLLGITIALTGITLGLLSYGLCYMCFNLYRTGYIEEFAAMVIGAIFGGTMPGLIYIISATWKELSSLQKS